MKTKALIWFGLIFQFGFLLFILFQAPEPYGSIKIGLEQLQINCPTQAAIGQKNSDGNWVINTAGDYGSVLIWNPKRF